MAKSTTTNINHPQLVGDHSDKILVPTYNWTEYFAGVFKTFVGIKSYQHFAFSTDVPGVVQYKKYAGSNMQKFKLLKEDVASCSYAQTCLPLRFFRNYYEKKMKLRTLRKQEKNYEK